MIACWNEPDNLASTIRGIEETAPEAPLDIIAVNDGGPTEPFETALRGLSPRLTIIHNPLRLGHSYCRQTASARAGEWMLFTDAHMVFEHGWFKEFEAQTHTNDSKTLFCGPFVSSRIDWERDGIPPKIFWGARLYYWERTGDALDVLSYKPLDEPAHRDDWPFEVPCVIGANYFIRRDWFEFIDGLKHFYGWTAQDEFMLSLKTWLFGGAVKLIPGVRLRHVWQSDGRSMSRAQLLFNKLSTAYQIFPSDIYQNFLVALPKGEDPEAFTAALQIISMHREALEQARFYFARNIRRNHEWFCSKFNLMHPEDVAAAHFVAAGS